jgi:hypothetical protein
VTARPPERDDLDALLDPLLNFAQEMLRKSGEFYPFGAVMYVDGDMSMVSGYAGSEHPPSTEVIEVLREGMRKQATNGEIRAAAICYDATIRDEAGKPSDAIGVTMEHAAGDSAEIFLPYSKPRFGPIRFGELSANGVDRTIFSTATVD